MNEEKEFLQQPITNKIERLGQSLGNVDLSIYEELIEQHIQYIMTNNQNKEEEVISAFIVYMLSYVLCYIFRKILVY